MKPKVILLALGLFGFVAAKANSDGPGDPGTGKGKKDELNGVVTISDTKKPLSNVTVTAYLVSRKEKMVMTDDEGGFAFDELKPGTYKFVFEKAGFRKVTKEKVVVQWKLREGERLRRRKRLRICVFASKKRPRQNEMASTILTF